MHKHFTNLLKPVQYHKNRTEGEIMLRAQVGACSSEAEWNPYGQHWMCLCQVHHSKPYINKAESEECEDRYCHTPRPAMPESPNNSAGQEVEKNLERPWRCTSCRALNHREYFYCHKCNIHPPHRKPPPDVWRCSHRRCRYINSRPNGRGINESHHHICRRCDTVQY